MKFYISSWFQIYFPLLTLGFYINDTSGDYLISKAATLLLGASSINFTPESFINFALYGHDDILFTLSDFLSSYGSTLKAPYCGSLIIGNDLKYAGIGLNYDTQTFAIPIPGSVVTEVPISYLPKFFPKGYTILKSPEISYMIGNGLENSTFDGYQSCKNCIMWFIFPNWTDDFLTQNIFWQKYSNSNPYFMDQYGYLEDYSSTSKRGLVKIYMYHIIYNSKDYYQFVDQSPFNEYNIHLLENGSIAYDGSLFIKFLNKTSIYNFYGMWSKYHSNTIKEIRKF